jgi:rod shape-determining protein MreD
MTANTAQLGARLAALALITVLLQTAAIAQISFLGATPDISPLVVVSVGLLAGPVPGAVFGFAVGLLVDVAIVAPNLGVSSLVLLGVGFWGGRMRELLRDPDATLLPLAIGAIATLGALVGFSLIQFLLGVEAPVSFELVRQIISTALINTLLALPVHAAVRRLIAPALPDGGRKRRRRRTRPGLSPLISP